MHLYCLWFYSSVTSTGVLSVATLELLYIHSKSVAFPNISTQLCSLLLHSALCLLCFTFYTSFIHTAIFRISAPSHSENSLNYPVKYPFKDSKMDVNTTLRNIKWKYPCILFLKFLAPSVLVCVLEMYQHFFL